MFRDVDKLKIYADTKIFVACPAHVKTGGTEAIHQFVCAASDLAETYLYFVNPIPHIVPDDFLIYNCKKTYHVGNYNDNPHNVIIAPETMTHILNRFKRIQKAIWWLSVDNYVDSVKAEEKRGEVDKLLWGPIFRFDYSKNKIMHFVQSQYAYDYLEKNGVYNKHFLSDYISENYLNDYGCNKREDIVFYNPKKGYLYTKKIIEADSRTKYIPLDGYSSEQLHKLLLTGKTYIDFGQHPGKDRIPREAAMSGLCVITGCKGAAGNPYDISIPDRFKFPDTDEHIVSIIDCIHETIDDYNRLVHEFDDYRKQIRSEKTRFYNETKNIMRFMA